MTVARDDNIIVSLQDISYTGALLDKSVLATALEEGPKSPEYTEAVSFLTNELRSLCNIDEQVNKITSHEDSISFLMELSSFLKELGCPYESLTHGHMSDRLVEADDKRLLLEYLITELMAARIIQDKKPDKKIELKLQETPNAANMKMILTTLRFPKPPSNLSVQTLFSRLTPTIEANLKKGGGELIGNPIFNLTLTDKQWHILQQVQQDLHAEYTIRREMLLTRLDCTIQSFQWSDRMKSKEDLLAKTYTEKRVQLRVEPMVNLSDLISARDDLAIIEKTSNASVRRNTRSSVNRVIIGQVPDRGGRTDELAPPPPEMPSWQQRSSGPSGGGGRGGRGGGQFQNTGRGGGQFQNTGRSRDDFSRGGGRPSSDYNRGGDSDYTQRDYGRGRGDHHDYGGRGRGGGSNNYSRGGGRGGGGSSSDYTRGGSSNDYNRGGSSNDYNRGGSSSNYNKGGSSNDYNRGGSSSDYNRGGNDYSRGNNNDYNNRGGGGGGGGSYGFDSAGSYGGDRRGSSNFDSAGSYGRGSGSQGYDSYSGGRGGGGFDSAGSYGGYKDYQANEPKRAKTTDYFQSNKTTYADQYVQESQHNQQYHSRDNRRGRASYSRGGQY